VREGRLVSEVETKCRVWRRSTGRAGSENGSESCSSNRLTRPSSPSTGTRRSSTSTSTPKTSQTPIRTSSVSSSFSSTRLFYLSLTSRLISFFHQRSSTTGRTIFATNPNTTSPKTQLWRGADEDAATTSAPTTGTTRFFLNKLSVPTQSTPSSTRWVDFDVSFNDLDLDNSLLASQASTKSRRK